MLMNELANELDQELAQAFQTEYQVQVQPPMVVQPCPTTRRPIVHVIRGFGHNKTQLTTTQKGEVTQLALMVTRSFGRGCQPIRRIRIIGHTDDSGTNAVNMTVGRRRAIAVRNEMKSVVDGILTIPLTISRTPMPVFDPPQSRGESQPIVPNTNAANRAQNRRVVVILD